jgi:hypothetical protein
MQGAMATAPLKTQELLVRECSGVIYMLVMKGEEAERNRLAEHESTFEGTVEALVRTREASCRQKLEDFFRVQERFKDKYE